MNYLAHLYLSGDDESVLLGNFIADSIKGKAYLEYDEPIQKGILLHRSIDSFMDTHPLVKEAKEIFRPLYKKHTGVFMDILYDHFLSIHWKEYSGEDLNVFIKQKMSTLSKHYFKFPRTVKRYFPMMVMNHWFERYQTLEGIDQVLYGMSNYTSFPGHTPEMRVLLAQNESKLQLDFKSYMLEIIQELKPKSRA